MHTGLKIAFVCFISVACMTSCSRNDVRLNRVTYQNDSTNHLDWVRVEWGGRIFRVGVMPPGNSATVLDESLRTEVITNVAIIQFINEDATGMSWESGSNEEVRARRENSWMRVSVDVSQLLRLGPEPHDVTFRILSLTNADVMVKTRAKR
jgi:hypothetical protein